MVVDSSALAAILFGEPERRSLLEAIEAADVCLLSVANWVEISIVIEARYGAEGARDLERFIEVAAIEIVPVDAQQGRLARDAWIRFGKGRHRAGLNYGDCFAYALAKSTGQTLLFKGDDFVHTDTVPI
ncbi:MAG: type II toxin-antitoxin system VapC family toxin [Wenzhouxiangellaceae bacterium]|nr:type II toxin-antitoxin system VapC family toxin [Wenzhouxiangellaceae bacterium]